MKWGSKPLCHSERSEESRTFWIPRYALNDSDDKGAFRQIIFMAQTYTTTALVLKRRDHNEHDRLFCLYTKDYGKIDVLAKGTKKISSKLNSYLEPFYLIKVMIAKGKGFDKLANCNLIEGYQNLRQNLLSEELLLWSR